MGLWWQKPGRSGYGRAPPMGEREASTSAIEADGGGRGKRGRGGGSSSYPADSCDSDCVVRAVGRSLVPWSMGTWHCSGVHPGSELQGQGPSESGNPLDGWWGRIGRKLSAGMGRRDEEGRRVRPTLPGYGCDTRWTGEECRRKSSSRRTWCRGSGGRGRCAGALLFVAGA